MEIRSSPTLFFSHKAQFSMANTLLKMCLPSDSKSPPIDFGNRNILLLKEVSPNFVNYVCVSWNPPFTT